MLTLALDWDGTYTADPALWDQFIELCESRGHKVLICTGRDKRTDPIEKHMPIYYTSNEPKKAFLARLGIHPDIFTDDTPERICSAYEFLEDNLD